jgi:methyltransferase-like protein/16S rRNA G527 N7-methylase RsmG
VTITDTQVTGTINAYDEVPYESYPFIQTNIANLKTIAHIFGLNSPKLETAKILELGCAAGGNLIPMAINYPKAKFVGVDLSSAQTKVGNDQIKDLGLKNIEIKTASITDIDKKSYGEFDYIICHGVISWVPENVRHAIFKVCSDLLSPTGVAYVSYNTLPGWNMVRSIRDMMLFHSQNFAKVEEQVSQGKLLLSFIKDSLEGANNPYGEMLKFEADLLAGQPDYYLRHDHMEEINHQYYFHEFMKEAAENDLQYLGDAVLATMYLGNLPPKAAIKLQEINDIVRAEQYMDFITNRRFRSTILCKKNIVLNRAVVNKSIEDMYFNMNIEAAKPLSEVNLDDNSDVAFYFNNSTENKINTSKPSLKAMLYAFAGNKLRYLSIKDILDIAPKMLSTHKLSIEEFKEEVLTNLLKLIFTGYVTPCLENSKAIYKISEKPLVSDNARKQLTWNRGLWVTNSFHTKFPLHIIDNYILRYLDGNHTEKDLIEKLLEHVKAGDLSLDTDGKKITDDAIIRQHLPQVLQMSLEKYMQNALLIG